MAPEVGGRADRSQASDAGTGDEDLGRRHLAGGGDLAVEEAAEGVGGFNDGAVASDAGLRGQRVHLLGALSVRGSASMASTVAFLGGELLHHSGFCAGQIKEISVPPSRISPTSSLLGPRTFKTISDEAQSAAAFSAISAPAAR
jgi:hypothetical protein